MARRLRAKKIQLTKMARRLRTKHFLGALLEDPTLKNGTPPAREAHLENHQNIFSEHFWKIQLSKMARSLRAKHIWTSKSSKHNSRSTFGRSNCQKWHAACARSTLGKPSKHLLGALLEDPAVKNGTPPAREARLEVKIIKTPFSEHFWKIQLSKMARRLRVKHAWKSKSSKHHSRSTFGRSNCQKWHAACARSTLGSQNHQNTILGALLEDPTVKNGTPACARSALGSQNHQNTFSEHFWKIQLSKMARRLRVKHAWKSKSSKHHSRSTFGRSNCQKWHAACARSTLGSQNHQSTILGALLEDPAVKNGTPPARKARLEVKIIKAPFSEHFWKIQLSKMVRRLRSTFGRQNHQNTILGALLEDPTVKNGTPPAREAHLEVKIIKAPFSEHFWKIQLSFLPRRPNC